MTRPVTAPDGRRARLDEIIFEAGVVTVEIAGALKHSTRTEVCMECGAEDHASDAVFCGYCGARL